MRNPALDNFDRIAKRPTFLNVRIAEILGDWLRVRANRRLSRRLERLIARPLLRASMHLDVDWQAAAVHQWDHDLPADRQAQLFATRLLEDTARRITCLFDELPELETLGICVREPLPRHAPLLRGTAARDALHRCAACPSPPMTLKLLGIAYHLREGRLEPLD